MRHFYDTWTSWPRIRMPKRNKGPQQSPVCHWTAASNTHQESRGKRNQYWLMQHQVYLTMKMKQEKKRRGRRGRWDTFWRPAQLLIVIRHSISCLCCTMLMFFFSLWPSQIDPVVLFLICCTASAQTINLFQSDLNIAFSHACIVPHINITACKVLKVKKPGTGNWAFDASRWIFLWSLERGRCAGDQHPMSIQWHLKGTAWHL